MSGPIVDGTPSSIRLSTAVSRGPRSRPLSSCWMISISGDESSVIDVLLAPVRVGTGGGVAARVGRELVGTVAAASPASGEASGGRTLRRDRLGRRLAGRGGRAFGRAAARLEAGGIAEVRVDLVVELLELEVLQHRLVLGLHQRLDRVLGGARVVNELEGRDDHALVKQVREEVLAHNTRVLGLDVENQTSVPDVVVVAEA